MTDRRAARPVDVRLALPAAASWLSAAVGLGLSPRHDAELSAAFVTAGLAALLLALRRRGRGLAPGRVPRQRVFAAGRSTGWLVAAAALVCSGVALSVVGLKLASLRAGPLVAFARARASVSARIAVTGDPQPRVSPGRGGRAGRRYVLFPAVVESVRGDAAKSSPPRPAGSNLAGAAGAVAQPQRVRCPVLVLASDPRYFTLLPSQHLTLHARATSPRRGDLLTAVLAARGPPEELTQPSRLQGFAADVRGALRRAADRLPTDEAGLLPGLVVGDTSRLPAKLRADFQLTGLTHLTAVSGANLAIVVGAVLAGCRVGGVGPRLRAVVAGLALAGFVVVARPSPSVLRAAVMGLIAISGTVLGRRGNPLPALSGAVLALVLLDPGLARSIGFTLSVLATAGIVVWAPPWGSRLRRILPGSLAELVAIPAAAQLACAPVIAAAFGQVSLVAVPANLLAAIAVAPATLLGALAALAGSVLPPLAAPLVWLAAVPTGWLVLVAHGGAAIPGAAIGWPSGCVGGLLVVAAVIAGGAAIRLVRGDMLTLWPTSRRRSR